ncbi:MAG: aldehyde dehydrogenase family protein [Alphaproteobacteria bacterium]|nr:aldehyde dehydrogenase family protein [Alphaproteobacteria bacterium]
MVAFKNYVAGEWVDSSQAIVNRNPADLADVVGEYARGDKALVGRSVAAAQAAVGKWSQATPQERADALDRIGTELLARRDELGKLLTREEGKIVADGVGEVARAGAIFKFFAGEAVRLGGEKVPSVRFGVEVEIAREPVGVVGIITPWNFPIAIPAWKIAPALAYGNCVVFKPAELVPGSAWALTEIIAHSGLPAGAFNLVMGSGAEIGDTICGAAGIDAISFTGSTAVGAIVRRAVTERGARVQLEMGGKNPLVVLDDADLPNAVGCAINGAYFQTGQRCTASSRLIVTAGVHDRFVAALVERLQKLAVGPGLDPASEMGPVVSEAQLAQDQRYLAIGRDEGARLAFGGERLNRPAQGYYMAPALFTDTHNAMRINREEIFGPVASVQKVNDFDTALETANDTEYGLSSGICTRSLKYASAFKRHSRAGMVTVNLPTAGVDYHVPFGGRKNSSYGPREQGAYAREFYTAVKTSYILPI